MLRSDNNIRLVEHMGQGGKKLSPTPEQVNRFNELTAKLEGNVATDEDQIEFLGLLGHVSVGVEPALEDSDEIRLSIRLRPVIAWSKLKLVIKYFWL